MAKTKSGGGKGGGGSTSSSVGRRNGGGEKKKSSGVKHTTVKNINGTSKKGYQISNLKEKYKKATGTNPKNCAVKGKKNINICSLLS